MPIVFGSPEALKIIKADREINKPLQQRYDEIKAKISDINGEIEDLENQASSIEGEIYDRQEARDRLEKQLEEIQEKIDSNINAYGEEAGEW